MNYYLIDNQHYSISQFFADNHQNFNYLYIATGYLDLHALQIILPLIQNYTSIKILLGQEPLIRRYQLNQVENNFPKLDLTNDLQELAINPKYSETITLVKQLINSGKLEIKLFRKTFLHAKCYIFSQQTNSEIIDRAIGIIGSSNLTGNGISNNKNIELNHIEHNQMVVKYPATVNEPNLIGHYAWFQQLWQEPSNEHWEGQFSEILDLSPVGEMMFSSYEMYIKTLWELYSDEIDVTGAQVSQGHKLFEYQLKNANSLCKRLEKRKLAMLCDSVGLGKTITALEVITRYIRNKQRVVVICPKSLENQWEHAIRKHGLNLDVISLQNEAKFDQHMQFDRYAPVGLFVIDESHNLRTGSSSSRFEKVRQWIKQNNNAHSLLLTATPINNSISDLLNQILLASGGDANVLMLPTSNGRGMQNVVEIINSIRKSESKIEELTAEKLAERRARLHPILKEFVVRRTRQGILREQEVSNFEPKLHFPQEYLYVRSYDFALKLTPQLVTQTTSELTNPRINNLGQIIHKIYTICEIYTEYDENGQSIEKTLDDKLTILKHPIDQLDNFSQFHEVEYLSKCSPLRLVYQIIQFLGFIPYRYMIYHRDFYNKDLADIKLLPITPQQIILNRQKGLYGILRVVFLKRLESSFYALEVSLNNYRTILEQFKQAIQRNILLSLADLRNIIDQYGDDYSIDNLNIVNETSQVYDLADFEKQKMLNDIEKELSLLDVLAIQLNLLQQDNDKIKDLAALFRLIQQEHPEYNQGKPKILVFSYFADTIKHLEQQFKHYFNYQAEQCAFICGSNRTKIDQLTGRFAPKGKDYQLGQDETELQYLFATDVLSEGQNLQDCAILINYDLHWNPVRMIQRNGRINRIGSEYAKVLIYNMHPHSQLEEYLKLVKRLEYKIGLIRDTVGQDQRILTADEQLNPIEFSDDIEIDKLTALYSQTQANTIMQQLEDDEEYLTDDKFITDLRYFDAKYQDNPEYKQQIYNIAKGKFGRLDTKERNLLILTQMNDSNGKKLFNKFFMIEAKNKGIKSMDDLHALKLIRTDENNNQRQTGQQYKRYLDYLAKDYPQKFIATLNSLNNQERELDTGMQNLRTKFLKLILGMNYPEDICSMFDQALLYSNYSDYNQINKKLKRILKQPSSNEINQLLNFCEKSINSLDNSSNFTQPISCEGILYYGN